MPPPKNPNKILIKNNFYPDLSEIDVWNYYQEEKEKILNEINKLKVAFYIFIDINRYIIKRGKSGGFSLTNKNYNNILTGRTVSILPIVDLIMDKAIIDIDCKDFVKAKEITKEIYNISNSYPYYKDCEIRYTGKDSFHIIINLKRKLNVNAIRITLYSFLNEKLKGSKLNYTISPKRKDDNTPNIDLFRNAKSALYICKYSLSSIGLRCIPVNINSLDNFKKEMAKI